MSSTLSASPRRATTARSKERGMQYIVFGTVWTLPRHERDNPTIPRARCLEHGLETEMMSIFADETLDLYERFHARMFDALGDVIDVVRIASPSDYGEISRARHAVHRVRDGVDAASPRTRQPDDSARAVPRARARDRDDVDLRGRDARPVRAIPRAHVRRARRCHRRCPHRLAERLRRDR